MNKTRTRTDVPGRGANNGFDKTRWQDFYKEMGAAGYTPVFNTFLLGIILNDRLPLPERVLAVVLLQSWGRHHTYAVNDKNEPLTQAELGRMLNVRRQRIGEAVATLRDSFLLHPTEEALYPVADPNALKASADTKVVRVSRTTGEHKAKTLLLWAGDNPDRLSRVNEVLENLRDAGAAFKRATAARDELLSQIEENQGIPGQVIEYPGHSKKDAPDTIEPIPRTVSSPSLIQTKNSKFKAPSSSSFLGAEPEPTTTTTTEAPQGEALKLIAAALVPYGTPDLPFVQQLWRDCLARDAQLHPTEVAQVIHEKAPGKNKPGLGYFMTAVPDCFPMVRPVEPPPAKPAAYETEEDARWRERQLEKYNHPDTPEEEKRVIRLCLGITEKEQTA